MINHEENNGSKKHKLDTQKSKTVKIVVFFFKEAIEMLN